ncbi:hypothetical protein [Flexivirga oryzae]|uniref:Uncharacterized protein n=1 Tax=Flexivirga oryzae TaxID=1794944 RepID=A0A839N6L2_9MICO|nr:hypothetical protein [Flexivirga oryzae]MBB2891664.1 hypothetical protein [Flexivirga oryzae]
MHVTFSLNGHRVTSKSSISPTHSVENFLFQSQLLRTSSGAEGASATHVGTEIESKETTIAGGKSYSWNAPGLYNNTYRYYAGEVGGSWEVSGYPGFWWMNLRSPIWHCASSTSACYFEWDLPADAADGGYNA